jgi:DNA polymerase I-like protein with 3'-5' exonuclease and polymerase domains
LWAVVEHIHDPQETRIVACIHDSVWVESAEEEEHEVREVMERVMTTAMSLSVPLSVDFEE